MVKLKLTLAVIAFMLQLMKFSTHGDFQVSWNFTDNNSWACISDSDTAALFNYSTIDNPVSLFQVSRSLSIPYKYNIAIKTLELNLKYFG